MPPRHTHMPPVQNNQPGTGFGSRGRSVGLVLSVTPLGWLPAPRIDARGVIWAHIQINTPMNFLSYPLLIVQTPYMVHIYKIVIYEKSIKYPCFQHFDFRNGFYRISQ